MTSTAQAAASTARIAFNRVGSLPTPEGVPAPQIFLLWGSEAKGDVPVISDEGPDHKWQPAYSFSPMGSVWSEWSATGWEDCEVGSAVIEATGPDGLRYRWEAAFAHDGDPRLEFWGARFSAPVRVSPAKEA